jgi:hypothetical protein
MKAKTQTLFTGPDLTSKERLKELIHRGFGDRVTCIRDPKLEHAMIGRGKYPNGLSRRSVRQRVAKQI